MKSHLYLIFSFLFVVSVFANSQTILIEAESFTDRGGWVVDQQSIDQLGSSYLLAHGLGIPVKDAVTSINITQKGKYQVWVRTRDWVATWGEKGAPGKFKLLFNNEPLAKTFGTEGVDWHWQDGGIVHFNEGKTELRLKDLTGFAGRCDAILLTRDLKLTPPNDLSTLSQFRKELLGFPKAPELQGDYDLVVIGGGIAGICAAVSAARYGNKVALIQNRPVLGGNNSSEVRVGLSGLIYKQPFPNLGKLVDAIGGAGVWSNWEADLEPEKERSKRIKEVIGKHPEKLVHNAGPKSNYGDDKKELFVLQEKNIDLYLNTHVYKVNKNGNKIVSVVAKDILTGKESIFRGKLFVDCTGDGSVGYLAGADYQIGRESFLETNEGSAPKKADKIVMGTSIQWYAERYDSVSNFPACPWALKFTEETCHYLIRGDWDWETGFERDQIEEIEQIRDYGLRAAYGNWDFLKNKSIKKDRYQNFKLAWVAYIGGKRESRRLMGDLVLREQDLVDRVEYHDASFSTTWTIDLHYPKVNDDVNPEPYLSESRHIEIEPYAVPYRCLYSRNIDNLFMAGRNISVTHVALGSVRVQRTTGMMGEVVGMAASIAIKKNTTPRGVYRYYLEDLKQMMTQGVID